MQRKRRNISFRYFSGSSGKSRLNNSITIRGTLHSIPTVRMSNKRSDACVDSPDCGLSDISHFTNLVRWTSPHLKNRTRSRREMTPYGEMQRYPKILQARVSQVVMIPLSRMARYRSLSLIAFALGMTVLINCCINIQKTFAADNGGYAPDLGTISPINFTSTPPTAGLSLSKVNMTSEAVTPGNTATASTNVTVNVSNAESYELYLKVNSATMSNGGTTINAGNATNDNTWGYKWDNASSYSAPSTSGSKLTVPALSNNTVSFTKPLTFATKFATSATPGTYKNSGTLSLITKPKAIIYTLDNLTQMQQLSLAPSACANTPYLDGEKYSKEYTLTDVRDGATYTVRKLGDGRCWMTQNLRLDSTNYGSSGNTGYLEGRTLNATTSDFTGSNITIPNSSKADFTDANKFTYRSILLSEASSGSTGYYNWYTATAGAGNSSVTTKNQNVNTSICPKGWTLPSGGSDTANSDFGKFATANSIGNNSTGSSLIQNDIYNFKYTGSVDNGSLYGGTSRGRWWSSTASGANDAYGPYIDSSYVNPGTSSNLRYGGYAVRCIARDS